MVFEKEVRELRNLEDVRYSNPNEWEVIQGVCSSLERDSKESFNNFYYSYHGIQRNTSNYNEEAFEMVKKIFYKLNPQYKRN